MWTKFYSNVSSPRSRIGFNSDMTRVVIFLLMFIYCVCIFSKKNSFKLSGETGRRITFIVHY